MSGSFVIEKEIAMSDMGLGACRVLVVEDEMLIAMTIEDVLQGLGCEIVGPVATIEKALKLAQGGAFDAAILDVTIRGGKVYPVAEQLLARGIPFVLASGYGDWALPEALRDQPRLTKPFTSAHRKNRSDCFAAQPKTGGMQTLDEARRTKPLRLPSATKLLRSMRPNVMRLGWARTFKSILLADDRAIASLGEARDFIALLPLASDIPERPPMEICRRP
jgi:CheY-like chemotaxis protein